MYVRRSLRMLVAVLAVSLVAVACADGNGNGVDDPPDDQNGADDDVDGADDEAAGGGTIGFSVYDMQPTFFQAMEAGTQDAVEAAGYEYTLHDQQSDESQMVSGAQNLLQQDVDALIISPFRPDALGPIIEQAQQTDTPVVVNDIGGGDTDYDAIVISDNEQGGVQAADYLDDLLSARDAEAQVASITCEPSAVYAARRNQGFEAQAAELGYDVVASLNANSNADEAYTVMQDILSSNPDVAGVFACNDPMAVGAANAIIDAGMDPVEDIAVVGFNADEEAIDAINADNLAATVAQFPSLMGELSVELATDLIDGESLDFDNADEREMFAPVVLVTPDNIDTYEDEATLD